MKKLKRKIYTFTLSCLFYLLRIVPIQNNKIIFSNFDGKGFGDNPKYIYLKLKDLGIDIDAVWIISDNKYLDGMPKDIRVVENRSLRKCFELATAKIWVDNCRKPEYSKKRRKQFYINTWHGGIALKKVEKDALDVLAPEYLNYAVNDSKNIDLMISNSRWCTEKYRESFWYDGEILESGSPRNDVFFDYDYSMNEGIRKSLGINDQKIIIYAPTFRKNKSVEMYAIDFDLVVNSLTSRFGGKWSVLLRLHPSMPIIPLPKESKGVSIIDVSKYGDIYELLRISDVLITDYSSISFDFMLTRKPVFLYAEDINNYNEDRGTYFNLSELPFPLAENNAELYENIKQFNSDEYIIKLDEFLNSLKLVENGTASYQVARRIISEMKN